MTTLRRYNRLIGLVGVIFVLSAAAGHNSGSSIGQKIVFDTMSVMGLAMIISAITVAIRNKS